MYLIVGLGNPGLKYKNTRHNAGFLVIDELASMLGLHFFKKRFSGLVAESSIAGQKVVLLKPATYMNRSGDSVREARDFYKLPSENVIVIYDDIDLSPGALRIRAKGSSGTHNGMRSIIAALKTESFPRIRVGMGGPKGEMELADFVLSKIPRTQKQLFKENIRRAAEAARVTVAQGVAAAQMKYNARGD